MAELQNIKEHPEEYKRYHNREYKNCMECHIEPDWFLVYQNDKNDLILINTGSHSEILNK